MTAPRAPFPQPGVPTSDADSPLAYLLRMLRQHWGLLIVLPFIAAVAAVTLAMAKPRTYTSSAAFMAASSDLGASGMSGIAAQFGFRLPAGDATQSPQFYADLLRSRQLMDSVLAGRFKVRAGRGERDTTLADVFEATGKTPALRHEVARDALDRATDISIGRETGVLRIGVTTTSPELSRQVVTRFLQFLNHFNLETRQSRATAERRFTQNRLRETQAELRDAEERLQSFRRLNRSYAGSPDLMMQHERLQRDLMAREQISQSLLQAYEQARIDEVRDTPVITVIEAPYVPARPDPRGLLRVAILGSVLGFIAGAAIALLRDLRRSRVSIAR